MRYLVQLLIPALIFAAVLYALTRSRRRSRGGEAEDDDTGSDTVAFIVILMISGAVALGTAYLLIGILE